MSNKVPDFQKIAKQLIEDAQTIAEVEMINFVMGNFEKQGFTNASFEPWEQLKNAEDADRAILRKDLTLFDSISVTESNAERVVVSAAAKHASIHNEGGMVNIPVTKKMRKFFWAMYYKTKKEKWKGMALTSKTHFSFKMPKRQFMGDSISFNEHIEDLLFKAITNRFKQHLNTN